MHSGRGNIWSCYETHLSSYGHLNVRQYLESPSRSRKSDESIVRLLAIPCFVQTNIRAIKFCALWCRMHTRHESCIFYPSDVTVRIVKNLRITWQMRRFFRCQFWPGDNFQNPNAVCLVVTQMGPDRASCRKQWPLAPLPSSNSGA